jgi:glycine/D-amino acid oxidase-like deaminating enzyme
VVVGAGAWGLPAAAELARRGHAVTLVDRYGPGNPLSSSTGPTRLWRLGDPDAGRVRLSQRGLEAMDRLAARSGTAVYRRLGLLWRDDVSVPPLLEAVRGEGVAHREVAADDVGELLPGLRPDGRPAVWLPDAGVVLAAASLAAQQQLFVRHGGRLLSGPTVAGVTSTAGGAEVTLADGSVLSADVAVLAPGPGAVELLPALGIRVPVRPFLEQVVHLADPSDPGAYDDLPCLFDARRRTPSGWEPGVYAMPSPGIGYKIGMDDPVRELVAGDDDRTPVARRTREIEDRARRDLAFLVPRAVDAQLCTWTDSPDGRFLVDRLDNVVLAGGDSGEGFKYSALMGEVLADLAEGRSPDEDVAALSLARFGQDAAFPAEWVPTALGHV